MSEENMTTVNETTEPTENNNSEETNGSPVGTILATGALLIGGIVYAGRKIFRRKKYHTVDHGRFTKE